MLTLYLQPTGLIGRFYEYTPLVALLTCRDLLFSAKHLFVAAMVAITSAGRVNEDECDRFSREFKVTRAKADSASILRRRRTFLRLLREAGAPS
jgi:hypothetical protein